MKKSTEIKNIPIFSIMDGKEVGNVRSLLINADKGMAEYLIVETTSLQFGIKAIPFDKIEGIGDYAVTIESDAAILELSDTPSAHDMLVKNIQIVNNKVMTKKGSLLGNVSEYYIDEITGKILGCVLASNNEHDGKIILEDSILTFGKEVVVVVEEIMDKLISFEEFAKANGSIGKKPNGAAVITTKAVREPLVVAPKTEVPVAPSVEIKQPEPKQHKSSNINEAAINESTAPTSAEEVDVAKQFEDRQALFLKGKRVNRDFIGEAGEVIVPGGSILTEEHILKVKALGRNKLLELSMSITDK
jgi:uncharacterized protein YrrD